jgi:hypothetical protein
MLRDAEIVALLGQAARNLDTLELLVRSVGEEDTTTIEALKAQLRELRLAYTQEANILTTHVLARAVERRRHPDRRRQ